MKKEISGTILLVLIGIMNIGNSSGNQSRTFYVSPGGNDGNSGLSIKDAWASIGKVNSVTFQPGDSILFESGRMWNGHLRPPGSGKPGKPITITSYGKGPKPIINIGKEAGPGIRLVNQSWWEIRGIEITSGAPPETESAPPEIGVRRMGILATVDAGNNMEHLVIRDCYIHDIWGSIGGSGSTSGSTAIMVNKGGGSMDWEGGKPGGSIINDILIENNTIRRFDRVGIHVRGDNSIVIRGNYMENLGGDGIFVTGANRGLIERNVAVRTCMRTGDPHANVGAEPAHPHTAAIWIMGCTETIMQFNEVYDTGKQSANLDGMAYDFDHACKECILQYNYSARNRGGWLLIMPTPTRCVARYNISENDQYALVTAINDASEHLIHNNVFYVDYGAVDISYRRIVNGKTDKDAVHFRNNIFYATGQGRFRTGTTTRLNVAPADSVARALVGDPAPQWSRDGKWAVSEYERTAAYSLPVFEYGTKFFNNCYFGPWLNGLPNDPKKLVADPMFVEPGSGGIGLSTLGGYKLKPESPCINAGVSMPFEVKSERDFYGNPVNDGAIDIGAYEYKALKAPVRPKERRAVDSSPR
jgi:hypothetical protein